MKNKKYCSFPFFLLTILVSANLTLSPTWGQPPKNDSYLEAQKLFEIGNKLVENNDFEGAIANYLKSIKINPLLPGVHYNLGNVYVQIGEIQKGVDEYKAAIKIKPLIPDYHRNLGYAYALQKKGELAKQKYQDLQKLSPKSAAMLMEWINAGKQ